jgi:hypothetical protein
LGGTSSIVVWMVVLIHYTETELKYAEMGLRALLYRSPTLDGAVAWQVLVMLTILVRREEVQAYKNKIFHMILLLYPSQSEPLRVHRRAELIGQKQIQTEKIPPIPPIYSD